MKIIASAFCLLLLAACATPPRNDYVAPVRIIVDKVDQRRYYQSGGIPWGDFVIAPAHTGRVVEHYLGTTTIFAGSQALSVVEPPIFSSVDDWCLLRVSQPVAEADIELFEEPHAPSFVAVSPRRGGPARLIPCAYAEWPADWLKKQENVPTTCPKDPQGAQATTEPSESERPSTFGLLGILSTQDLIEPGSSGSPVFYYDQRVRKSRVCGMVTGGDEKEHPLLVLIVPFWAVGEELIHTREEARARQPE